MALPASGAISFNAINVELGVAGTTQASLNQASYRTLAGVPSGAISMSDFYGKANQFAFTISSNQTNANLRTLAVNAGWNESTKVVATIGSGVYCGSDTVGTPGLTISGSFPGGVELINNGFIIGRGGTGGNGSYRISGGNLIPGSAGSSGGIALSVSTAVTINNTGTIGGGGGGGGGGGMGVGEFSVFKGPSGSVYLGGGGGGGGRSSTAANGNAGSKGLDVQIGSTAPFTAGQNGTAGTNSAAGSGGSGGSWAPGYDSSKGLSGAGGSGGNWGSSGASGAGGFGFGAQTPGFGGGGGGTAISGNSNITYIATGTRLGAIT
jgi:hypothetical protein